jgi:hypothetical protein
MNLAEWPAGIGGESLIASYKHRRPLRRDRFSVGGRSASEKMQKEHNYADYQHEVNEAGGNVKGQEPKQPKNNENCGD